MDKTFCIFGDSVTQAAYVKAGWVDLLRKYLEGKYKNEFVNVFNLGIGGNTTEDVLERLGVESQARNPTTIIFAIGINDSKSGNKNKFRVNLGKIIEKAKKFSNDITFIGLVLGEYSGDESYTKEKAKKYDRIINEVAESRGCRFIELFDRLEPNDFMDGLHPNEKGHEKMFEIIKGYF